MKIVFVSNYINHHQIPFCEAMRKALGEGYTFIQTEPMEEERVKLGWQQEEALPYVKYAYDEPEACQKLVMECDIVIWGGLEDETMLKPRLDAGKPVIRYSERLYKSGQWKAISPRGLRKKYQDHTKYRKAPVYLLCAGAYVASDFHIIRAYPQKRYQWGYFPACKAYDVDKLLAGKLRADTAKGGTRTEILWAARFIDWKHPELVIHLADRLRQRREDFHITMIGGGELQDIIASVIKQTRLEEYITLAGTKTPQQVREAMEKASIFLMTSDREEGWGAVMNEAMNSGCAVVADPMEGAALSLIKDGENGLLCKSPTGDKLAKLVESLLDSKEKCESLGRKAYETITQLWNAEEATKRLLCICEDIVAGKEPEIPWKEGPCSRAEVIKERR